MGNLECLCFISACGGSGCTSASRAFSAIASKLYKKKNIVISLDVMTAKTIPAGIKRDEAAQIKTGIGLLKGDQTCELTFPCYTHELGTVYLSAGSFFDPISGMSEDEMRSFIGSLSGSYDFDLAVFDIPLRSKASLDIALCCEKIVVVCGYLKIQRYYGEMLYDKLCSLTYSSR